MNGHGRYYSSYKPTLNSNLEEQFRNMGIFDIDRQYLVPKIDGTTTVGRKVDDLLGNNEKTETGLGYTFKTFDSFDESTGIATSVKAVNLNAKSYQDNYKNQNQLSSKLNEYINKTLDFDRYQINRKRLEASNINQRVLHIVVDDHPLTPGQQINFQNAINYANLNGVEIKITINMGINGGR